MGLQNRIVDIAIYCEGLTREDNNSGLSVWSFNFIGWSLNSVAQWHFVLEVVATLHVRCVGHSD